MDMAGNFGQREIRPHRHSVRRHGKPRIRAVCVIKRHASALRRPIIKYVTGRRRPGVDRDNRAGQAITAAGRVGAGADNLYRIRIVGSGVDYGIRPAVTAATQHPKHACRRQQQRPPMPQPRTQLHKKTPLMKIWQSQSFRSKRLPKSVKIIVLYLNIAHIFNIYSGAAAAQIFIDITLPSHSPRQ
jgi:hypothetical protein